MLLNKKPSIERLYQSLEEFGKDRKGIVYAINISHANAIAEFYREHGIAAVAIDIKTPSSLRKELIGRFKASSNTSFSKTHPSSLTLKGGSTAFPKPLSPQGTGDVTAPPRRSEPLRSKDGGPSKVSPDCAGWDRLTDTCLRAGDGLGATCLRAADKVDDRLAATCLRAADGVGDELAPIQVLVNVDIFSEGFDCPDVEFVQLARPTLFSKTHPSSLTLKGGSTAFPKPLSPQGTGDVTAPPRRSEPLRSKDGGPSKVSPDCAGWDRLTDTCLRAGDGLGATCLRAADKVDDRLAATCLRAADGVGDELAPIQVLVNVDIFSEGFDCPDVEFVQLARPTL